MGGHAWVTLATNDSYSLGALVLAHSLKKAKTAHKSVVLITPAVSQPMREQLQTVFDVVKVVDVLDSKDEAHLALMKRPELGITFTKIHCWRLVEFEKCVFLDADTLVVRNCDELFEREEFSAAPDVSWPDCFNSGVFVFRPSLETFNNLLQFAVEKGSFDGGDQGLLNQFFGDWATEDIKKHLPFVYNLTSVAAYSYIPAFKHYGAETRIVHFIGAGKPWLQQLDPATRTITPTSGSEHLAPLLQQWWDLFCEKVHPNLDKNLESSNDGMSHPPVDGWTNSLPVALTDESERPRVSEPCTPYREKDDFRQYNLPYQPFDVRGSSGELLNVEFLLASVVRPRERDEGSSEEQQRREGDESSGKEEREESEGNAEESEDKSETTGRVNEDFQGKEERISEWKADEGGEGERGKEEEEKPEETEEPPPPRDPFDYDSFFPDETCISNYLQQNVMTYQPYDRHHHRNTSDVGSPHVSSKGSTPTHFSTCENSPQDTNSSEDSFHQLSDSNADTNPCSDHPLPPHSPPSLPRFLTIPENDKRQSGNTETHANHPQPKNPSPPPQPPQKPTEQHSQTPPPQTLEEKRELVKSKSMPFLCFDVTEVPAPRSSWKSQPDVSVDPSRKFSMPKLKPILPRQSSFTRSVTSVVPKVTLYTELLMSSDYKDPADLPKDKVGFVETFIRRKGNLRRSKSAADIADKFGPLPYTSPETEQPLVLRQTPLRHLDNGLHDLSQCKRQLGNKPKAEGEERRKENSHLLPALRPLLPPKEKKSTLIKKRKSKELSPGDGGREKMMKREAKTPRDRKRTSKIIPRNVSETANGNSVDEILQRLREFSKNYQHFFGEVPQRRSTKCKNSAVQSGECETSEGFSKSWRSPRGGVSRGTQTGGEEDKSERQGSSVDSGFRQFRNYVKEKSSRSRKGLLSIQDLVSGSVTGVGDVKGVKAAGEVADDCGDSGVKVIGRERVGEVGGRRGRVGEGGDVSAGRGNVTEGSSVGGGGRSKIEGDSGEDSNGAAETVSHSDSTFQSTEATDIPVASESKSTAKSSPSPAETVLEPSSVNGEIKSDKMEPKEEFASEGNSERVNGLNSEEVKRLEAAPNDSSHSEASSNAAGPDSPPNETPTAAGGEVEASSHKLSREYNKATASVPTAIVREEKKNGGMIRSDIGGERSEGKSKDGGDREVSGRGKSAEKTKNPDEILCVPDFETPRSSRVVLPTSLSVATEVLEEMIRKATAPKSEATEQARSPPGKPRKAKPRKAPGPRLANGNASPNDSPDRTDPVGGEASPAAEKLSPPPPPPPILRNGSAVRESQEEERGDLKSSSGIAGAIAQLSLEAGTAETPQSTTAASAAHQEYLRRQNWETGNVDYMGRDSFDNIWSKICQTLEGKEAEETGGGGGGTAAEAEAEAAVVTKPSDSAAVPPEEAKKPEQTSPEPPAAAPGKCPEVIETLPSESVPVPGPLEDDEIIFSKPDDRQSCLTNIKEEEDLGKESSAPGRKVKLSDILGPEMASPSEEKGKSGESGVKVPEGSRPPGDTPGEGASPTQEKAGPVPPEATKPTEKKPGEAVPDTTKPTGEKAGEGVSEAIKPTQERGGEKVPDATTPTGEKAGAVPAEAMKPTEKKAGEAAPEATKPTEMKAGEAAPEATKPTEMKAGEAAPEATKPTQMKAGEAAPEATKPTEMKAGEAVPEATKPTQMKAGEAAPEATKPTEMKAGEAAPEATKPTQMKAGEAAPEATKPTEMKAGEAVPEATKPTEEKVVAVPTEVTKPAERKIGEALPEVRKPTGEKVEEVKASSGGEKGKQPVASEEAKGQPQPEKAECKTEGKCQPLPSPAGPRGEKKEEKEESEKKAGECTTVAIPSPPILFPGAPFGDKEKTQSKGKEGKPAKEKFDPIPLPPPDSPTVAPGEDATAKSPDPTKDEGKQKKGVFTKILEMVGVAPKERPETETSKSVFYVEGAAPCKQEPTGTEPEAPSVGIEAKEEPPKDEAGKPTEGIKKTEEAKPEDAKAVPPPEQPASTPPKPAEAAPAPAKPDGKSKPSKPARNSSPKESTQPPTDCIPVSQVKSKSPSPKLTLPPQTPPETAVIMPTPPPQSDAPPRKNSGLLKVDETILETPPVPEPPKEEESAKGRVLTEVEEMIGKAKSEVESRLQDRRSAEKEPGESTELVNTMKLMMGGSEEGAQSPGAQSPEEEVEELRVTTEEERMRHKGEVVSSKLSDQILKAIPPPRRKAISEASASTSSIPKQPPSPEQKTAPGETKPKPSKPSSIPVPPPRNRGKPTQQTPPSKGKGKK